MIEQLRRLPLHLIVDRVTFAGSDYDRQPVYRIDYHYDSGDTFARYATAPAPAAAVNVHAAAIAHLIERPVHVHYSATA